ncbi:MFS transporter [Aeromicrobium flavum]|uniref:MFS transporter n=1 Tax=Aeromicrobium flavum TaxID=416568 RepID=A0A512HXQ9_9ACTN|nr:MFS transporter [Aeromicrobium flavum]GEO90236.1 MFS transporter [Aeromicrobium flavum]
MTRRAATREPSPWLMLAAGMVAQVTATAIVSTPLLLIPYLHLDQGLSLLASGSLAAAPAVGTLLTLVAWGAIVDHVGERISLTAGLLLLVLGSALALAGARGDDTLLLASGFAVCGVAAGSSNSASGRLVVGWFPAHRRGLAMGIRQTGLPLGVGLAALVVPAWVDTRDVASVVALCVGLAAAATAFVGLTVVDPPRGPAGHAEAFGNPYRGDTRLVRIHAASALLVIPQYVVWSFMLLWLIERHGWSAGAAGALYAAAQGLGAAGRIGVGWWSDRVGDRLGPMRQVAMGATAVMLALALLDETPVAIAVMVVATAVTVADNGLAFTAVAEIAGPRWSGRAFGLQNTGQYLTAAAVPPVVGALIQHAGYGWAFAAAAIFPLVAVGLVPVATRR